MRFEFDPISRGLSLKLTRTYSSLNITPPLAASCKVCKRRLNGKLFIHCVLFSVQVMSHTRLFPSATKQSSKAWRATCRRSICCMSWMKLPRRSRTRSCHLQMVGHDALQSNVHVVCMCEEANLGSSTWPACVCPRTHICACAAVCVREGGGERGRERICVHVFMGPAWHPCNRRQLPCLDGCSCVLLPQLLLHHRPNQKHSQLTGRSKMLSYQSDGCVFLCGIV